MIYADDFIITGSSKELLEKEVKPLVEQFLRERGLELSPEKTFITHIEQGFDFLGQNTRKYGGRLLITPSKKNLHAFLERVRTVVRTNPTVKQEHLIGRSTRSFVAGRTITVTLWRLGHFGKRRWSYFIVSGDGPNVGIRKSRLLGSRNGTGTGWDGADVRSQSEPHSMESGP